MEARDRRPRSALATVWILVACAVIGTGIGLVVRQVRVGRRRRTAPNPRPTGTSGTTERSGTVAVRGDNGPPRSVDALRPAGRRIPGVRSGARRRGNGLPVRRGDRSYRRRRTRPATRSPAGRTCPSRAVCRPTSPRSSPSRRGALWLATGTPIDPRRAHDGHDDRCDVAHRRRLGGRRGRTAGAGQRRVSSPTTKRLGPCTTSA